MHPPRRPARRPRAGPLLVATALLACWPTGPVTGEVAVDSDPALHDVAANVSLSGGYVNDTTFIDNIDEFLKCEDAREQPVEAGHCAATFDRVLCWPHQPAGSLAEQNCFAELNGVAYDNFGRNATRWCLSNGTWESYSNYSACMVELVGPEAAEPAGIEISFTIYCVGYIISTIALAAAVTIFSYFSELHCLRNRIHMNLMLSYIGADIVWMAVNIYLVEYINHGVVCFTFVFFLHYTLLTHFLWMFVEGLYLYTLVVKTFQQGTAKLPVYLALGWGLPFVIVVAWVITRLMHPPEHPGGSPGVYDSYDFNSNDCPWVGSHWSDWVFQGPILAILAINCIFLALIMYVLITKLRSDRSMRPVRGAHGHGPSGEEQQSAKAAKALLVLIPLLGITYILVIAGPTEGSAANVFAHARALLLSTQGLLVALFYCFLNTDVRHTLRNRWGRWRDMRMVGRHRNGRAASVNWTNKDTESCITTGHVVGDKSPAAFKNGHDQQQPPPPQQQQPQPQQRRAAAVSWLDRAGAGQSVSPSLSGLGAPIGTAGHM